MVVIAARPTSKRTSLRQSPNTPACPEARLDALESSAVLTDQRAADPAERRLRQALSGRPIVSVASSTRPEQRRTSNIRLSAPRRRRSPAWDDVVARDDQRCGSAGASSPAVLCCAGRLQRQRWSNRAHRSSDRGKSTGTGRKSENLGLKASTARSTWRNRLTMRGRKGWRNNFKPLAPGMTTSSTIASGLVASTTARPDQPESAWPTVHDTRYRSAGRTITCAAGSSITTSFTPGSPIRMESRDRILALLSEREGCPLAMVQVSLSERKFARPIRVSAAQFARLRAGRCW